MVNIRMITDGDGWVMGDKGFISGWVMDSADTSLACIVLDSKKVICAKCSDFLAN